MTSSREPENLPPVRAPGSESADSAPAAAEPPAAEGVGPSVVRNASGEDCLTQSLNLLKDTYNYNHWIYSLLRPHIGPTVLEIGSGPGNLTRFFLSCERVVCLDPDEEYVKSIRKLASVHLNVESILGGIEQLPGFGLDEESFSTAVCLNVLEHIEDDRDALERTLRMLAPGGKLLLYVPAGQWAYGELDRNLGHVRRYSKSALVKTVERAGFRVARCHSVNFVGAFGWFVESRLRKARSIDPRKAQLIDRLVPLLSALERLVKPPFGQSLFVVAERPPRP